MKNKNVLNLMGLCQKSGNLKFGSTLILLIPKNKIHLVIMSTDVAHNTEKRITNKCSFYNVPLIREFSGDELSNAVGKSNNIKAVGILDSKLAKKIKDLMED